MEVQVHGLNEEGVKMQTLPRPTGLSKALEVPMKQKEAAGTGGVGGLTGAGRGTQSPRESRATRVLKSNAQPSASAF